MGKSLGARFLWPTVYYRSHSWRLYTGSCRCSCVFRALRSTKSDYRYRGQTYKYHFLYTRPEPLQTILTQRDSLKNEWAYVYTRQWKNDYTTITSAFTYLIQQEDTQPDGGNDKWPWRITKDCIQYLRIPVYMCVYVDPPPVFCKAKAFGYHARPDTS